ncbi:MFS transporter [Synergistales bacterium]|nr:MFS transporter [Synergistales bacterium]GHV54492.1 MFS transporter [Synergistales bacterium]
MRQNREMRRKDRLVTDRGWIDEILKRGTYLNLGLAASDGWPYIVPICYGYRDNVIYLHGAAKGMKTDILAENRRACFQITDASEVVRNPMPAEFSMKYRSVTGFGIVSAITDAQEKTDALNVIMDQYEGPHIEVKMVEKMGVWVARLDIESVTGKNNNYPL